MRGLIAGVMGGAAKGYTQYANQRQEIDLKKEMMAAEEEKQLRVDEIRRQRDLADIPLKAQADAAAAPILAKGKVAAESAGLDAAREAGIPEKRAAYAQTEYEATKPLEQTKARDKAKLETELTVDQINTPGYLKAIRDKARAGHVESAGSLAQAALANLKIGQEKTLGDLRTQLAAATDPAEREAIKQKISDMSGSSSSKSFSDVVQMGNGYVTLAKSLRAQAEKSMDPDEAKTLSTQAAQFEAAADQVFKSVGEKRGVQTAPPKGKPAPAGTLDLNQFFKK